MTKVRIVRREFFVFDFRVCMGKPLQWCPDTSHGHFWRTKEGEGVEPIDLNPIIGTKSTAITFLDRLVIGAMCHSRESGLYKHLAKQINNCELPED